MQRAHGGRKAERLRLKLFRIVLGVDVKDLTQRFGGMGMESHRRVIEIAGRHRRLFEMAKAVIATHQRRTVPIADDLFCFRRHEMHRDADAPVAR